MNLIYFDFFCNFSRSKNQDFLFTVTVIFNQFNRPFINNKNHAKIIVFPVDFLFLVIGRSK